MPADAEGPFFRRDLRKLGYDARKGYDEIATQLLSSDAEFEAFIRRILDDDESTVLVGPPGRLALFLTGVAVGMRLAGTTLGEDA